MSRSVGEEGVVGWAMALIRVKLKCFLKADVQVGRGMRKGRERRERRRVKNVRRERWMGRAGGVGSGSVADAIR